MIVARQLKVVLRNGKMIKYTHVTGFSAVNELVIQGERLNKYQMAEVSTGVFQVKDVLLMEVEYALLQNETAKKHLKRGATPKEKKNQKNVTTKGKEK